MNPENSLLVCAECHRIPDGLLDYTLRGREGERERKWISYYPDPKVLLRKQHDKVKSLG